MPTTRRRTDIKTSLRKGKLGNAAKLTLSRVAKLVNLPVAQDIAHHIHQITVALKAPKDNDSSAKELADHLAGLLDVLDTVLLCLNNTEQLEGFRSQLRDAHAELKSILEAQYTTKLASQTQIQDRIVQLREGISRAVQDLTLRLLVVSISGSMHDHQRTRKALTRTQRTVTCHRDALLLAERRLAMSNHQIQELQRICEGLQRQGGAHEAILM
ncbi:unnamed protein product, partial [Rhizoctonia solani]